MVQVKINQIRNNDHSQNETEESIYDITIPLSQTVIDENELN